MNIFVLDRCPKKAAQMACDKHVVKMILETAQMLCTVASDHGFKVKYRPTHRKHPCTLWIAKSSQNWQWLIEHGMALCAEYTVRYGKQHKSQAVIETCSRLPIRLPHAGLLPFAQAMPAQYRHKDPVKAYRAYYHGEKAGFATWKTQTPKWWRA